MSRATYKDVIGHPGYRVGDDGTVWSQLAPGGLWKRGVLSGRWKQLRTPKTPKGYRTVSLMGDTGARHYMVHVLVLTAFLGPKPIGMQGCHGDNNRENNQLLNLRWDTPKNNQADRAIHGTRQVGVDHPRSKLTESSVRFIRTSRLRYAALASLFDVNVTTIGAAKRGETWSHIV